VFRHVLSSRPSEVEEGLSGTARQIKYAGSIRLAGGT